MTELSIVHGSDSDELYSICMLNIADVDDLKNNPKEQFDLQSVFAYLARIAQLCDKNIAVLSPQWSAAKTSSIGRGNEELNARHICFGDFTTCQYIILPLYFASETGRTGHFTIGFYELNKSVIFYDPLQNDASNHAKLMIKQAILELAGERIRSPIRIYTAKPQSFNKQDDGYTCGVRICLIAQLYLMSDRNTYVQNLNIDAERSRMLDVLYSVLPGGESEIGDELFNSKINRIVLSSAALHKRQQRLNESVEEKQRRLSKIRSSRESETSEERESRLSGLRQNQQIRLESETAEERESRLSELRQNQQIRLESETADERESRLSGLRQNQQIRLELETAEERESRLFILRQNEEILRSSESVEEREIRLSNMRQNQQIRLDSERSEERNVRLSNLRQIENQRRATETLEERQKRLAAKRITDMNYRKNKGERIPSTFRRAQTINDNEEPLYIGRMEFPCKHCQAMHYEAERTTKNPNSFNECCRHGKVLLPNLPEPTPFVKRLLEGTEQLSRNFFENIRRINSSLSFASLNPFPETVRTGRGPRCVKVHGQITFAVNKALMAEMNEDPSHAQLFILDTKEATDYR